ncbi:transglycosylase family protein [Streptomyces dubilierae]|uniref:Transglycosylase family protein n=1 Tax=Streptomyces dubilierae TaxID=3075533 RepID=A0ABU2PCU0_9ACTN|nr:transglycosylase family protein [Streptomyces sp. DSM 41921]MDT0388590.1 transglycosylase family protein [Streptomyces sp. DSM 41921]
MLSGNGRHRRPRQAPALLVAAGVTGSAIAIPLLGASGASAADGSTWDRVADCETGGAWSQNSGNGYYGGLALSQEDWENHGGLEYAASADLASRSQQISVAERILADQGVGAWRTCGLLSGLEQGAPDRAGESDPSDESASSGSSGSSGLLDSLDPSGSSSPSPSTASPAASPSGAPSDGPSAIPDETAKSDKSPEASSAPSAREGSGGSPSASPEAEASGNSRPDGGSSGLADTGSGRHRGPSADEGTGSADGSAAGSTGRHAARDDAAADEASAGAYIVGVGDDLWSIADSLRISGEWQEPAAGDEKAAEGGKAAVTAGQTPGQADEVGER